ncbi:MAG: GTPase ObgE [Candidatus Caenarcaniphilales bacterium]|nr:GTPase ObgE [Candidatus Caenarcaniphilales bacterium]
MFIDTVKIKIASGKGGNGACTFLQEKFVAYGGPDGGDGGAGGSVYIEADSDMTTLLDFRYESIFKAQDGAKGSRKNMSGKGGEDLVIYVPIGTIVRDSKNEITIADLKEVGQKVLVAQGGRGGRGNARFKSNKMRVPNFCEPGEAAVERELELELKLIADLGIIGMPNAGKSTLISKISAAKPKIADYAFTTLAPNLGVVRKQDGNGYTVADIPGLIEGAGEGKGLGFDFLRHVERTRFLVHLVDVWGLMGSNIEEALMAVSEDPLNNFIQINYELDKYSQKLSKKKQIVVLNKIEGYPEDELASLSKRFEEYTGLKNKSYDDIASHTNFIGLFAISAVTGDGVSDLLKFVEKVFDELPVEPDDQVIEIDEDTIAASNDDSYYFIAEEENTADTTRWAVHCGKLERLMKVTDLTNLDSLQHLFHIVRALGVIKEIKSRGAKEGDLLNIDGVDFDVTDAVLV